MMQPGKILVIEDEKMMRESIVTFLEAQGHTVSAAEDGLMGLQILDRKTDLILIDIRMPRMDGLELTKIIRRHPVYKDIPILIVTGLGDTKFHVKAADAGANDFIAKPFDSPVLRVRTETLIKMKQAQDALKVKARELEDVVRLRTEDLRSAIENLQKSNRKLHQAWLDTIECMALAAEYRDTDTGSHVLRIASISAILAKGLSLPAREVEIVFHATSVHDVGKIGIPDSILLKPGPLTEPEFEIAKSHTLVGGRIFSGFNSTVMKSARDVAFSHHEKWDGTGYPPGLAGKKIPRAARICAVADVFDSLTIARSYKEAFSNKKAYKILEEGRGTHFEPRLIDIFFEKKAEIEAIQAKYQEEEPHPSQAPPNG